MKILHVIDSGGVWGAEKMLFELVFQQIDSGHEPLVLSIGKTKEPIKSIERAMEKIGIPYKSIRIWTVPSLADMRRMKNVIQDYMPDVIHSHGYKGNVIMGFFLKPFLAMPVICTLHGWVTMKYEFSKLKLYEVLDSLAIRKLDAVVTVSEKMLVKAPLQHIAKTAPDKLHVIQNGISNSGSQENATFLNDLKAFSKGRKVIASVGRLSVEKGFDDLIQAFSMLAKQRSDLVLVIVGDGECRSELESLIHSLSLSENVWITGYVEDIGCSMSLFDIYVCSSLTEGLPITILEAMRAEIPVISTAISNIPELLQMGKGGMLVEPGSPERLSAGIAKMLSDLAAVQSLTACSKVFFEKSYSSQIMERNYRSLYESVCLGFGK